MTALSFILVGMLFTAASPFPTTTDERNYTTLPEPGICGISVADRIIGGKKTAINAYPWAALMGVPASASPREIQFLCGGSLISEQFVLSAAHCFILIDPDVHDIVVRLGEWDIESDVDCIGIICADKPMDFYIELYQLHESFDPAWNLNDVALMKLPRPVGFTEFISPVCLPLSEDLQEKPKIGRIFTVIGWGNTGRVADKTPFYGSRYKKETRIPVTDSETCGSYRTISSSEFCAENSTDSQSCKGDSGGPVVAAENDGYWYQYGIVSWGSPCGGMFGNGNESAFGVFVRVSSFLPWIMKTMRQLGDTSTAGPTDVE
ncbi:serine protease 7-like [Ochlerotatus camptorhynchus]|uniref:serine protease 7-like n=1 Tax=Ochlerotatus camptorhynchus TaxID=644619 RepID=UPI0031DECA42